MDGFWALGIYSLRNIDNVKVCTTWNRFSRIFNSAVPTICEIVSMKKLFSPTVINQHFAFIAIQ
jgi:hypothetical protein